MKTFTALVILLAISVMAYSAEFAGTVVHVHDGDTAHVKKGDGTVVKVRFTLSDAPEIDQPHGVEARDFVRHLCLDKQVTVKSSGTDDFGRTLGEISVNGTSVNRETIKEGHGWWFYHYHSDEDVGKLEVAAKVAKKGLWAAEAPLYPRAWRRGARLNDQSDGEGAGGSESDNPSVFIMAMLPNPKGEDVNNETVILANSNDADISVDQWKLEDDDNGVFTLSGTVPAGGTRTIRLNSSLELGNAGDTVRMKKATGDVVQTVSYSSAASGKFIMVK